MSLVVVATLCRRVAGGISAAAVRSSPVQHHSYLNVAVGGQSSWLLRRTLFSSASLMSSGKEVKTAASTTPKATQTTHTPFKYEDIDDDDDDHGGGKHQQIGGASPLDDMRANLQHLSPRLRRYFDDERRYDGKLVYIGQLTRQLRSAKFLSLTSSVFGLCLFPFLNTSLSASSIVAQLFVYGTTGFFIFVTPLFSQFLGRRYISRLYYNADERRLTAVLFSFLMREYRLELALDDLCVPDLPGPFSTVMLKSSKRSFFLDLNHVADLELLRKIYGYDKPFDLYRYDREDEQQKKSDADFPQKK